MAECLRMHGSRCAIQVSADKFLKLFRKIPGKENASMKEAVETIKKSEPGKPTINRLRMDLMYLNGCANCVFQGFRTVVK